jgi:hypothetical protein
MRQKLWTIKPFSEGLMKDIRQAAMQPWPRGGFGQMGVEPWSINTYSEGTFLTANFVKIGRFHRLPKSGSANGRKNYLSSEE